jgi:chitin synthase
LKKNKRKFGCLNFDDSFEQIPLKTMILLKHKNGKKLSSHMWFFQGFCRYIEPKYCVLVDVGTMPEGDGIFEYYRALENGGEHVAGVSGFMGVYLDKEARKEEKIILNDCIERSKYQKLQEENLKMIDYIKMKIKANNQNSD